MPAKKQDWELRVVVGPSGCGRRTRLGFLQELFGFMSITLVEPRKLNQIVRQMFEIHGNKPFRLAVEISTVPFRAEAFKTQYKTFVDDCVAAFTELQDTFPGEFKVVFMYCSQAELAERQTYNYHPLLEVFGDMQTAIFTDCMIHLQLMLKIWALKEKFPVEESMVFSDRSGKTIDQLRGEISERRYRNRQEGPEEDQPERRDHQEKEITRKVKKAVENMNNALERLDAERAEKRKRLEKERAERERAESKRLEKECQDKTEKPNETRDVSSPIAEVHVDSSARRSTFITRGWNRMRTTMLEIARAEELIVRDKSMELSCLLLGDSGSGKEGIAAFLHFCREDITVESVAKSTRSSFITVDCTGFEKGLLESELFGTVKGAFTDAIGKDGLVVQAANGTLFFDEIGLMDVSLQAKLLRFIETKIFRKVGSTKEEFVPNCRIIAATSRNLVKAVADGTFLVDLYNRLKAITISLPSMRERREDIPLLLAAYAPNVRFSNSAEALLFDYDWPGNIRELKQVAITYQTAAENEKNRQETDKLVVIANMLIKDFAQTVTKKYIESALQYRWAMLDLSRESRKRTYQQLLLERHRAGKVEQDIQDVQESEQDVQRNAEIYQGASEAKMADDREQSFKALLKNHIKDGSYEQNFDDIRIEALKEVLEDNAWVWLTAQKITGINREKIRALMIEHALEALQKADGNLQKAVTNTKIKEGQFRKLISDNLPPEANSAGRTP